MLSLWTESVLPSQYQVRGGRYSREGMMINACIVHSEYYSSGTLRRGFQVKGQEIGTRKLFALTSLFRCIDHNPLMQQLIYKSPYIYCVYQVMMTE